MAEDELKFRITADDEATEKVDRSNASLRRLKDTTQQAGQAADETAQQDRNQAKAMDASAAAAEASESSQRSRAQSLAEMKRELAELYLQETRQKRALDQGRISSADAQRLTERRSRAIDRLTRDILDQADAERQVANALRGTGAKMDESGRQSSSYGGALQMLKTQAMGLVGTLIGAGGVLAALRTVRQEMEENIRTSQEYAEASLNLQFLDTGFDKKQREYIKAVAAFGGRKPSEVVNSLGELQSLFPLATEDQLNGLLFKVAETGITTPASLASLGKGFGSLKIEGANDQQAQNLLLKVIEQGGVNDPGLLGPLLGDILPVLRAQGKLDLGESAGAASAVTGVGMDPRKATTALRMITLRSTSEGTPESREILDRVGATLNDNVLQVIEKLASGISTGTVKQYELEKVYGAEAAALAAKLTDRSVLEDFKSKVRAVDQVEEYTRNLTRERIETEFRGDPLQSRHIALKRLDAEIAGEKIDDIDAMDNKIAERAQELELIRQGVGPTRRKVASAVTRGTQAVGASPEDSVIYGTGASIGEAVVVKFLTEGELLQIMEGEVPNAVAERLGRIRGGIPDANENPNASIEQSKSGVTVNNNDNRQITHIATQLNAPGTQSPYTARNGRRR